MYRNAYTNFRYVMPYKKCNEGSKMVHLLWGQTVEYKVRDICKKIKVVSMDSESSHDPGDEVLVCTGAEHEGKIYGLDELPTMLLNLVPDDILRKIAEMEVNKEAFIRHFIVYFYDDFVLKFAVYPVKIRSQID